MYRPAPEYDVRTMQYLVWCIVCRPVPGYSARTVCAMSPWCGVSWPGPRLGTVQGNYNDFLVCCMIVCRVAAPVYGSAWVWYTCKETVMTPWCGVWCSRAAGVSHALLLTFRTSFRHPADALLRQGHLAPLLQDIEGSLEVHGGGAELLLTWASPDRTRASRFLN